MLGRCRHDGRLFASGGKNVLKEGNGRFLDFYRRLDRDPGNAESLRFNFGSNGRKVHDVIV